MIRVSGLSDREARQAGMQVMSRRDYVARERLENRQASTPPASVKIKTAKAA